MCGEESASDFAGGGTDVTDDADKMLQLCMGRCNAETTPVTASAQVCDAVDASKVGRGQPHTCCTSVYMDWS